MGRATQVFRSMRFAASLGAKQKNVTEAKAEAGVYRDALLSG
jgi:hypothetical protein